jgi:hypothetical protein
MTSVAMKMPGVPNKDRHVHLQRLMDGVTGANVEEV